MRHAKRRVYEQDAQVGYDHHAPPREGQLVPDWAAGLPELLLEIWANVQKMMVVVVVVVVGVGSDARCAMRGP